MTVCPTCHAERDLTPAGVCTTCHREGLAPGIPGAARSLFGPPAGSLFDVATETPSERLALRAARRTAARPVTETVSPADITLSPPRPLDGQRRLF